ncbi:MAG: dipeptide epimerase, partial [Gammaproteobacteria bacterium]|nr:dipeptide epimerase [Gammaproteobacteria bacterium]
LHDLLAQHLNIPLVEMLGRVHDRLPTSVTIGINSVEETVADAAEHVGQGFRILKIKLGHSLEEDLERLHKLRERFGTRMAIRVDPNQGYSVQDLQRFVEESRTLDIEFIEQPLKVTDDETLRSFPASVRQRIAMDESLLRETDAIRLIAPPAACGIFNIKLMKCGGIQPAKRIATIAEASGIKLMWGCMDESAISISAALHTALACSATRFLDLDGSLELNRDVVTGGFVLQDGYMSTSTAPGLGVTAID